MTVEYQVARLQRAFPRQELSRETLATYFGDLAPIPVDLLDAAITELLRTSEWFPTIAAIRNRCAELSLRLPRESEAIAQVDAYSQQGRGATEGVARPHPLVALALGRMGGLRAYRASERPDLWRADFTKAYRTLRAEQIEMAQASDGAGTRPD